MQPIQKLAIKSMLAIPWYRLRFLCTYMIRSELKIKKIIQYLGSERKRHAVAKELIGDNPLQELAPFSFKLPGGETTSVVLCTLSHTEDHTTLE